MNERIKQLADQATVIQGPTPYNPLTFEVFDKEKFAQLIVLECEKVAKNPQWYGESPSNGWRNPIRHVCNAMKEHFGVEE
jgi:hypothetical protein